MNWRDVLHTATDAVRAHRLRSALTMLGILIGITAVVLTVGIGQGARAQVQDDINALGTNLLVISPGSSTSTAGIRGGFGSASTLTEQDADTLQSSAAAPDIEAVAPVSTTSASLVNGTTNWTTTLTGTTPHGTTSALATPARVGSSTSTTRPRPRPWWSSDPTPRASCSVRSIRSDRPSATTASVSK